MAPNPVTIRRLEPEEMGVAISLSDHEGWNPGIHDGLVLHAGNPDGVWAAEVGDSPVGVISAVWYNSALGFVGSLVVDGAYRGRGIGGELCRQAEADLKGCSIGLYTPEQTTRFIEKQGFHVDGVVHRCRCEAGGVLSADPFLVPLTDIPFDGVAAFDSTFFYTRREAFVASWITRPGVIALGVLQDGHLAGYGVLRQASDGYRIGPLYAMNPSHAYKLFNALKAYGGEGPVYIDIPQANPNTEDMMKAFELTPVESWSFMVRGTFPPRPLSGIYGITSLELG